MATDSRRRAHNETFSRRMVQRILATPAHPLSFLIDPATHWWRATRHGSDAPSVQIGHAVSFHSGAPERLFLEDADFNQVSNWKGERHGAIFTKSGILIGGVPVELRTAQVWENTGLLPKGTVSSAVRSDGWTPG